MADLMADAAMWLNDQLTDNASVSATYKRGANSVTFPAAIGRTEFSQEDASGVFAVEESVDFLFSAAKLILAGAVTTPVRGDQVRYTIGATVFVHEVLAPAGEPVWQYSDPYKKRIRVHTKLVGTE